MQEDLLWDKNSGELIGFVNLGVIIHPKSPSAYRDLHLENNTGTGIRIISVPN